MKLLPNILRTAHPYRKALFNDPDHFWRWCPDSWPEPYRSNRRQLTGRNLAEVRVEMATLREEVARLAASVTGSAGNPLNDTEVRRTGRVHVPASMQRRMGRRPRSGS